MKSAIIVVLAVVAVLVGTLVFGGNVDGDCSMVRVAFENGRVMQVCR